jgi:hypothetical protein
MLSTLSEGIIGSLFDIENIFFLLGNSVFSLGVDIFTTGTDVTSTSVKKGS